MHQKEKCIPVYLMMGALFHLSLDFTIHCHTPLHSSPLCSPSPRTALRFTIPHCAPHDHSTLHSISPFPLCSIIPHHTPISQCRLRFQLCSSPPFPMVLHVQPFSHCTPFRLGYIVIVLHFTITHTLLIILH